MQPLVPESFTPHGCSQARKLRTMDGARFRANPEFETSTEQLADLMQLCVEEVARLQGKAAKAAPPPVPAPAAPKPAPPPKPEPVPVVAPKKAVSPPSSPAAPVVIAAAIVDDVVAAAPVPPAPVDPVPLAGAVPYTINVSTSDVSGGAFDGQVFITLQGANGNSTEVSEHMGEWGWRATPRRAVSSGNTLCRMADHQHDTVLPALRRGAGALQSEPTSEAGTFPTLPHLPNGHITAGPAAQ